MHTAPPAEIWLHESASGALHVAEPAERNVRGTRGAGSPTRVRRAFLSRLPPRHLLFITPLNTGRD